MPLFLSTAAADAFRRCALALSAIALNAGACVASAADSPQLYDEAMRAVVSPGAEPSPLKTIPTDAKVQVVTWMKFTRRCEGADCPFTAGPERWWVTLDGEVQSICRQWGLQGQDLRERMAQLLGLSRAAQVDYRDSQMITVRVSRDVLRRPCLGEAVGNDGLLRCSLHPAQDIDPEFMGFVRDQMKLDATGTKRASGFPFTGLGFTFDRHPASVSLNHYGATEFVLRLNTTADLVSMTSTDSYCSGAVAR